MTVAATSRDYYGSHQDQIARSCRPVLDVLRDQSVIRRYRSAAGVPFDGLTLSEIRRELLTQGIDKPESSISGRCNDLKRDDLAVTHIEKRHCTLTGSMKQVWRAVTITERKSMQQRGLFG